MPAAPKLQKSPRAQPDQLLSITIKSGQAPPQYKIKRKRRRKSPRNQKLNKQREQRKMKTRMTWHFWRKLSRRIVHVERPAVRLKSNEPTTVNAASAGRLSVHHTYSRTIMNVRMQTIPCQLRVTTVSPQRTGQVRLQPQQEPKLSKHY